MIGRVFGIIGALIGAAAVVAVVMLVFIAKHYRMPAASMEPTLHCARPQPGCKAGHEDHFIVFTFLGYGRGDVVAFDTPPLAQTRCGVGGTYVKRIIGIGGDTVAERNGYMYVDGKRLPEPYVPAAERDLQTHEPVKVESGHYYLLGDNRSSSCDSRVWGTVPKENVVGKIFAVYWPVGRIRFL